MNEEKKKQLAKAAYLYFIEDMNQEEIAKEMNLYRTTVSRMITQAKKEGIVEVKIKNYDLEIFKLEKLIKSKYSLKDIEIVPTEETDTNLEKEEKLSQAAANWLRKEINEGAIVGLSWGESIGNAISHIDNKFLNNSTFVPIVGGPSHVNSKYHVNTLVYELARKFHGQSLFVNATVIQETKQLANGIFNSKYFEELRSNWQQLDIAIVGVGGVLSHKKSQWRDLIEEEDFTDLKLREAIGDCCCRFFDKDGKELKGRLNERTIGLTLDELSKVPSSVAIARGKAKARAILTLLKAGYINTLITDQETIMEVLKFEK